MLQPSRVGQWEHTDVVNMVQGIQPPLYLSEGQGCPDVYLGVRTILTVLPAVFHCAYSLPSPEHTTQAGRLTCLHIDTHGV